MSDVAAAPGVLMVDDNALACAAMERRFADAHDLRWIGWTADVTAALRLLAEHRPAVVLLDIDMPGVDTMALLRRMTGGTPSGRERGGAAVVMFSGLDQTALIEQAFNDGAAGYIHKDEPTAVIENLLLRASRGEYVLSPLASRAYMRAVVRRA